MRIIYSPDAAGMTWLGQKEGQTLTGMTVKNTEGLVNFLEFRSGKHSVSIAQITRVMAYRHAMKDSVAATAYEKPFAIDEIGTARACLKLRDTLFSLGWNTSYTSGHKKIDDLRRFEENFDSKAFPSIWERVEDLIDTDLTLDEPLEIECPVSIDLLPKLLRTMLLSLKGVTLIQSERAELKANVLGSFRRWITNSDPEAGVHPIFNPTSTDGSLEIWEYDDEVEELDNLAGMDDDFDLWINRDNLMLDSWLYNAGRPAAGSSISDVTPGILQIFPLSMRLFTTPDDPQILLGYLSVSECPVGEHYKRANDLRRNAGRFGWNETYGKSEFLPDRFDFLLRDGQISRDALVVFIDSMAKHLEGRLEIDLTPETKSQIESLVSMFGALSSILKEQNTPGVSATTLQQWVMGIYSGMDHTCYDAQCGCRTVVRSSDNVLRPSQRTIWVSAADYVSKPKLTDILSNAEIQSLVDCGCRYAERPEVISKRERDYNWQFYILPVEMTSDKLVLIKSKRCSNPDDAVSPLLVRLEHFAKFDDPDDDEKEESEKVYNPLVISKTSCMFPPTVKKSPVKQLADNDVVQDAKGMVDISIPEGFDWNDKWRLTESPSSLETLKQDPFDYVLRYMLHFEEEQKDIFPNESLVKGNVAHITVQNLLFDKKVKTDAGIDKEFEDSFNNALNQKGLILCGHDSATKLKSFADNLQFLAKKLLKVINDNGLEAEAVEFPAYDNGALLQRGDKTIKIEGNIDMLLHYVKNPKKKVVFDFKYTSKPEDYISLLEKSSAIQLVLYREMLTKGMEMEVVGTAYYLMSDHKEKSGIYTADAFLHGDDVHVVGSMPYDEIEETINRTYWERRSEIENGKIELGQKSSTEGTDLSLLDYPIKSVPGRSLLPLKTEGDCKRVSKTFTNFKYSKK